MAEKKFISRIAQKEWEMHTVCIMIYPNIKECIPRVFPIFLTNQTHQARIMLPNGSIFTVGGIIVVQKMLPNGSVIVSNVTNRTVIIKGLGKVKMVKDEIEIESETSHSFIREIRGRPVIVTIVKTKNETHVMVTNLISGVKNEIDVEKEEGVFKHFVIHTKENVSNVVVNITRIKNLSLPPNAPVGVNQLLSKVLIYKINANVSDTKLKNVTISLTLNQSWLNQANTSIDKIMVIRISENGSSMVLPILNITSEKIGNETFYHLTVASPGFSYYAIIPPLLSVLPVVPQQTNLILLVVITIVILLATLFFIKKIKEKRKV